ncbi:MAG: amidohydrolase family protein [Gemmatimonadetes bacterium]|nr:amidohydrolase family protein [Gemmatimonadota bacterium]
MRRSTLWRRASGAALLATAVCAARLAGQAACTPQRADTLPLVMTGVTLWDGTGNPGRPGTTIVVTGERITAVFPDGSRPLPPAATVRALTGKFVIPGLIDGHTHVAGQPSGEDNHERTARRLCRALLGGITAIRDMAGDVRTLASLQRDALVGDLASPDIFYSALWAGPAFFSDPRTADASAGAAPGSFPWMRAVDEQTDLRQAVAEARGSGATALKLYQAMSPALVARIAAEGRRQGLELWAHAAMRAVKPSEMAAAGIGTVSHAFLLLYELTPEEMAQVRTSVATRLRRSSATSASERLFATYRRHGTVLEPTLFIMQDDTSGTRMRVASYLSRRAHAAGVPLLAGTDSLGSGNADGEAQPNLHAELELLVTNAGLTPAEALLAATRTGARVLGRERVPRHPRK